MLPVGEFSRREIDYKGVLHSEARYHKTHLVTRAISPGSIYSTDFITGKEIPGALIQRASAAQMEYDPEPT
ncbi:hypothetical protein BGAL_0403g00040 [Botrytis galanthina]|uniref:Uncharacterized protein n=1 Tax=Botrytis galanthina TaxID=278940 RepID=A0A4V4HTN4_9HELO|nr:hypothetical protein BGAL_0403g00040 [Botrytis galanthina]